MQTTDAYHFLPSECEASSRSFRAIEIQCNQALGTRVPADTCGHTRCAAFDAQDGVDSHGVEKVTTALCLLIECAASYTSLLLAILRNRET